MSHVKTPDENMLDPEDVAKFFLSKDLGREDPDVTQMKLHKLMYLAQANFLGATGHRLFDSNIEAFEHGPIIRKIYAKFRDFNKRIIVVEDDYQGEQLESVEERIPVFEREFLEDIWDTFSPLSAWGLRHNTHLDEPWKKSYDPKRKHALIEDSDIADWYQYHAPACNRVTVHYARGFTDDTFERLEQPLEESVLQRWGCA